METNLKDRILTYMKEDAFRPMLAEDIAEGMNLTAEEQVAFPAALEARSSRTAATSTASRAACTSLSASSR